MSKNTKKDIAEATLRHLVERGVINEKVQREVLNEMAREGPRALVPALVKISIPLADLSQAISLVADVPHYPSLVKPSLMTEGEPVRPEQKAWVYTDGETFGLTACGGLYFANPLDDDFVNATYKDIKGDTAVTTKPKVIGVAPVVALRRAKNNEVVTSTAEVAAGKNWVVSTIDQIINDAASNMASDIHFEPMDDNLVRIRMRIDGVLQQRGPTYTHERYEELANYLMDLAKGQPGAWIKPYDGMIVFKLQTNRTIKLRTAMVPQTLPSLVKPIPAFVLRLLGNTLEQMSLKMLGIPSYHGNDQLMRIRLMAERKNGLILITGPTGSGKTTTLTAANQDMLLRNPDRKYLTIQDPVEISQHGVVDVQVNDQAELTFARGLKAFLRFDPDVIILGEIRDHEVAEIALEASLTGHLVLASIHTNSASKTVARLLNMGLEPTIVADALKGVMAQRLGKKVCQHCSSQVTWGVLTSGKHDMFQRDEMATRRLQYMRAQQVYGDLQAYPREDLKVRVRGKGCESCKFTGYAGRTVISELMDISPEIQDLINEGASGARIYTQALKEGFREMWEHAFHLITTQAMTFDDALDALGEREISKLGASDTSSDNPATDGIAPTTKRVSIAR